MKAQILSSKNPILRLALEEIANKLKYPFDFAILAVSPRYPYHDVPVFISEILQVKEESFLAFHAIDAFENTNLIGSGVVACFITFEREGRIKKFTASNIKPCKFKTLVSETANYISDNSSLFHIIISDYSNGYFPLFLKLLSSELERKKIPPDRICGAIASTSVKSGIRKPGYLFTDNKVIEDGFVILSFENIEGKISLSTGIFKRGPVYTITSGEDFKIYELDGKPASCLPKSILRGIGEDRKECLWYTPFAIINDKGDPVALRTFKDFNDEYIEVWAPISKGQKVKLSLVIPEEILRDTERVAKKLKSEVGIADLCFDFSCTARQYTLEDRAKEELEIYGSIIDAPLFGFFTHGEIAPNIEGKRLELHNQTSVGIVLREI